ncbi:MAG: pyruvate carboxylase [Alphaproteobacteria bacterium]|nr:pyruvate carboxylase [Alphaproteobacteria bacterium]
MKIKKLLVANRGEIAIRVLRAANELGIKTVAIYANEDKLSLHRFKADQAFCVGEGSGPVKAYLDIDDIISIATEAGVDAIHPGYGFLSEKPEFAEAIIAAGMTWIGPPVEVMRSLGNKVSAREMAVAAGTPVMPATGPLPEDEKEISRMASEIGFPVMLKASWGGGGRGMRVIESQAELLENVHAGRREAENAFGNGEVYLEKLVRRARHVEVQLLGDTHGTIVHLWERDCSIQRRNQKVIERAPAPYLTEERRNHLCNSALLLAERANYVNAGTAEFLMDADSDEFYFIEVNPRIQVEHTVSEQVTGIDIVKAQIRIAQGARIGKMDESGVPAQDQIVLNGHAMQCRVTSEDPENNFVPDYGRISAYRGATGFGIRLDGGTAYSGAVITRYYDSLLEKVTAWASSPEETIARMDRALREFRIRGVATNITFVENLINHPAFKAMDYTTRFIDDTPELFEFPKRRDRATRLLRYIADVNVNGQREASGRPLPPRHVGTPVPPMELGQAIEPGETAKSILDNKGPTAVADWMLAQKALLLTDTTMRDAHQSLLATRVRTYDLAAIAPAYETHLRGMFSLECWGGATFDVAMRFLDECPWERLKKLRQAMPGHMLQMLFRGSNGVGYTSYPDNIVTEFIRQSAESGIDVFRVFDSLNWVENMRVAIDAVGASGKLCEGAICYTGDLLDKTRGTYNLDYYLKMAGELKQAGVHVISLKDMAGLLKPAAASVLIPALKQETGLPVHLHTHDTSGISAATVLAASEAGVDAADAAMDALSGLTSQPNLGSLVEALQNTDRETGLSSSHIRSFSDYWEQVRDQYAAFEPDMRAGASEVYLHEMPGGQFTNLKEQARSLGLANKWHEVAKTYADVNAMFGDIIKVTPSSKMVGDMALMMVSAGLTRADVEDPSREISFPESVVSFFAGDLGQPPNGFPSALQAKVLKGKEPSLSRPGADLPIADLKALRQEAEKAAGRKVTDEELNSFAMYPTVFKDYVARRREHGPMDVIPTLNFFYGMEPGAEVGIDLEAGKRLHIRCQTIGEVDDEGNRRVFFELNGQPRSIRVPDRSVVGELVSHPKADPGNANHLPAPMPGLVSSVAVSEGQKVSEGDVLLTIEAMKMETSIHADRDGTIKSVVAPAGTQIDAKDLLLEFA